MRYFLALGLCLSILAGAYPAVAADEADIGSVLRQARDKAVVNKVSTFYEKRVKEIYASGKPSSYDMANLREFYPQLEQYSPFSDEILEQISLLAFKVQNSQDPDEVRSTVAEFQEAVKKHFANIEVVFLAASLTEQDLRLGDPAFMKMAKEALYQAISESNTALAPEKAIKVVTFGEEDILLRRQGSGKLIKSELVEYGPNFINIHQMENKETGKITKLYFDVTKPISYAERKKAEQEERRKKPKKL